MVNTILSPIHESSSTSTSNGPEQSKYDDFELDDLFSELKRTTKNNTRDSISAPKTSEDELSSIRKTLSRLPKIQNSNEGLTSTTKPAIHKTSITQINDPIRITKKKAQEKNTAGSRWFDMPKGELTDAVKRDMKIIEQRAALDPKRHYKKDKWKTPEFFQIGTIVEGKHEFYSSRLKNKDRHQSILESVMNDDDTKHYFKRKYDEIQVKKTSGKKAHYKKVKEARRKF